MDETTLNIIVIIFSVIMAAVGSIIYHNKPDLHNCGYCGKYLDMKAKRYWYKQNGKNVPFCSKCNKQHS